MSNSVISQVLGALCLETANCMNRPKSATREEWFALTRDLIATTIEEMGEYLDEAELSVVEEHFIKGGLL